MIISVASGKGGTGKTLVATSLALSIADEGVQLLDCDVEEPNAHLLLNPDFESSEPVEIAVPQVDESKCNYCGKCSEVCVYHAIAVMKGRVLLFPELCHGCGACSYLCPEKAITEVGRQIGVVESGHASGLDFVHGKLNVGEAMVPPVIRKVKDNINKNSIAIIDVPPGTSCPVVEATKGSDYCILVTEPTPFGMNDLELAVQVIREMDIPCGVIINRAGANDKSVEDYCAKENIPILMKILLSTDIAKLYSKGIPLATGMPEYKQVFRHVYDDIKNTVEGMPCNSQTSQEELVKEKVDENGDKWRKVYFGGGAHFDNWLAQAKELGEVQVEEVSPEGLECFEKGNEKLFRIWVKE